MIVEKCDTLNRRVSLSLGGFTNWLKLVVKNVNKTFVQVFVRIQNKEILYTAGSNYVNTYTNAIICNYN